LGFSQSNNFIPRLRELRKLVTAAGHGIRNSCVQAVSTPPCILPVAILAYQNRQMRKDPLRDKLNFASRIKLVAAFKSSA
jgi:hypothetical protein